MKLSQVIESFLIAVRSENLSLETVAWYRKRLSRLVLFFNDCDLSEIKSTDDLRRFVVSLQEQDTKYLHHRFHEPVRGHLSPSTIQGYVRCIKRLFNWLEEEGQITTAQNIALRLKKPKIPKHPPKEIAESDLMALLRAVRSWGRHRARNYAMILFLAETGVRVAGLVNLRLSDVDLKRGQAIVTEKGDKSRMVFFGKETRGALASWLAERPEDTDYVFVGERGRLTVYGVRMVLRHLAKFAGVLGRVNPHSFRHTFAKRTTVQGGDVAFLSALMGHTDIKTTRDAYLIFRTEELQNAHERYSSLDGALKRDYRKSESVRKKRRKSGMKKSPGK
jgi:site-specific recombinase XerD